MTVDAVVLAGGGAQSFDSGQSGRAKAFLSLNSRPMIDYVLDALEDSGRIGKVIMATPEGEAGWDDGGRVAARVIASGLMTEDIAAGVAHADSEKVLVVSSDIPLLTREAVDDFIDRSLSTGADYCYPIVRKELAEAKFPETARTYVRLVEGEFTGGNIHFVDKAAFLRNKGNVDRFFKYRKHPLIIAWMIGPTFLIRLLLGRLRLADLEKKATVLLDTETRAVASEYPEIAVDIDKAEDWKMIQELVTG